MAGHPRWHLPRGRAVLTRVRRASRSGKRPPAGLAGPTGRYVLLVAGLAALTALPTYVAVRAGTAAVLRYGTLPAPRPPGTPLVGGVADSPVVVVPRLPGPAPGPSGSAPPDASYTSRWVWHGDTGTWRWPTPGPVPVPPPR